MWSTVAVGFKLGLQEMSPIQLLWIGGCLSWLLFSVCIGIFPYEPMKQRDVLRALALGLVNPFCYYLVLLSAYDLLPAHVAQPLNYTWAIVTAIFAVPLLKQRLSFTTIVGIVIGYIGVVVLVTKGRVHVLPDFDGLGVALALLSTVLWAMYWIWSVDVRLKPWWFMWLGFSVAMPLLTVTCTFTDGLPSLNLKNFGFGVWVGLLEMGFAFLLWQKAMARTDSAAKLSQLIFLSPVISLGLIAGVLDEQIHLSAILGIGMILIGLFVVNRRSNVPQS